MEEVPRLPCRKRSPILRFRLFVVDGVKIWLPVENDQTWIS